MRQVLGLALVMALATPTTVLAGSLAGIDMPDEVMVDDSTLQLNGMGLRKKLWVKVYVGGLYLETRTGDASTAINAHGTKRMVMRFMTNKATKSKMDSAWMEGFEGNSADVFPEISERVTTFMGYFGDMKDGDMVEMTLVPGADTTVVINGEVKGTIEGDDFQHALLAVWLGPKPPSDDFKKGLLGG